ncbi:MAG: hypothetical protein RBT39_14550 [Azoarcus sp.]|jgi:hypothetical protein|nr:hypothetical protein [Azoarcus sp.]MDX9838779.1 hypothetical protein [Azoarcus sp.]
MSIFTKTRKGLEEIETRCGGLHPRVRRLLIMIDGHRTTETLAATLNDERFEATLTTLLDAGYIEAKAAPEVAASAAPAPVDAPAGQGQIELARNFMMNTLKAFNGPYNKLGLMQRIHACTSLEELQSLFNDWLNSINETRAGRQRAEELCARLQAVM